VCAAYRHEHPGIEFEVAVSHQVLNLSKREADIALRPTVEKWMSAEGLDERTVSSHPTMDGSSGDGSWIQLRDKRRLSDEHLLQEEIDPMTERPTRIVKPEILRDLMERLLRAAGCTEVNARETAEVFLEADLRGIGLQGFDHLFDMLDDIRHGAVVKEGPATALVDGHRGPGQPGGVFATDLAIRKAREAGTATVGLVNGADIYMIGYYTDRMARAGMVGFVYSASSNLVHPHGGVERKLGTNPIAIAVPTAGTDPMLLDMATSVLSSSRVRQAAYHGEHLPPGSGVDIDGQPTTEAAAIDAGAIAPLAGHKGFGLGLCVALLSGPLVGGEVGSAIDGWHGEEGPQGRRGHLFMAIDPAAFGDTDVFRQSASAYLDEVRASRTAPGVDSVRIPGERTFARRARSLTEGVEILEATWKIATGYAAKLDIEMPN
jgi:LDH2 family malate/lactate/ureidoglycolate dehydrogenase